MFPQKTLEREMVGLNQNILFTFQKLTPHLTKSQRLRRSPVRSPSKRDNVSMASEPTFTTELATASVERGQDSVPTSLMATPIKRNHEETDLIEMTYTPQERLQ